MPPNVKISKEDIVQTAVAIIRRDGVKALNARSIAKELNCSTQPVFSNFVTMDELRFTVISAANALYREYLNREIASGLYPTYKATGMAYIRFAKEEKELFKLLFMRNRTGERIHPEAEEAEMISGIVQKSTGLNGNKAEFFHLEMWAYVHGIATMTATDYLELETELISQMLTDAYLSLKKRYEGEEKKAWKQ